MTLDAPRLSEADAVRREGVTERGTSQQGKTEVERYVCVVGGGKTGGRCGGGRRRDVLAETDGEPRKQRRETRERKKPVEYRSTDIPYVDVCDRSEREDENERPGRSAGSVNGGEDLGRVPGLSESGERSGSGWGDEERFLRMYVSIMHSGEDKGTEKTEGKRGGGD